MKKLLIGGFPCVFWSVARKDGRETTPEGLGWELFQNYVIAKEKFNPDYFFAENNESINPSIKAAISNTLGVKNYMIDAALVSPQHREREYWFNWECEQPNNLNIYGESILNQSNNFLINTCSNGKVRTIKAGYYKQGLANFITNGGHGATAVATLVDPSQFESQYNINGERKRNNGNIAYEVSNNRINVGGSTYPINLPDGYYTIRKLTPEEAEKLQCLPVGYTDVGISPTHRYMGVGNGWCASVVEHILSTGLKDVPRDEEIIVLSLYDGIGTGRYVLDKLGFTNVKYFAYEIEDTAIQVATINYPDIVECGDAFAVRTNDWRLPL